MNSPDWILEFLRWSMWLPETCQKMVRPQHILKDCWKCQSWAWTHWKTETQKSVVSHRLTVFNCKSVSFTFTPFHLSYFIVCISTSFSIHHTFPRPFQAQNLSPTNHSYGLQSFGTFGHHCILLRRICQIFACQGGLAQHAVLQQLLAWFNF